MKKLIINLTLFGIIVTIFNIVCNIVDSKRA